MRTHRTAAWPLAGVYVVLVTYASLFPFAGWRDQGVDALAWMLAPLPKYWTWFDLLTNVIGYMPLGFLLALSWLRSGRVKPAWWIWLGSTLAGALLSLVMESLQLYLPHRVPSNVDWLANTAGAWLGALAACALERWGWIARWSRLRSRWFVNDASGSLALLALWPCALLFPVSVPLGLGQVLERLLSQFTLWLDDSSWQVWLPDMESATLSPLAVMLVTAMGFLVPALIASSIMVQWWKRLLGLVWLALLAVGITGLSSALSYGPAYAWLWVSAPVQAGLGLGLVLGALTVWMPARALLGASLVCAMLGLGLVNQAPADPYFAQNLAAWEQGRFVRFHGLAQWLGWVWPYLAMCLAMVRLVRR